MLRDTAANAIANMKIQEALHHRIATVRPGHLVWSQGDHAMCRVGRIDGPEFHGGKVKIKLVNGRDLFFNPTDYVPSAPSTVDLADLTAAVWVANR